jgi:hypothetical protein
VVGDSFLELIVGVADAFPHLSNSTGIERFKEEVERVGNSEGIRKDEEGGSAEGEIPC